MADDRLIFFPGDVAVDGSVSFMVEESVKKEDISTSGIGDNYSIDFKSMYMEFRGFVLKRRRDLFSKVASSTTNNVAKIACGELDDLIDVICELERTAIERASVPGWENDLELSNTFHCYVQGDPVACVKAVKQTDAETSLAHWWWSITFEDPYFSDDLVACATHTVTDVKTLVAEILASRGPETC